MTSKTYKSAPAFSNMTGLQFEKYITTLLRQHGFEATTTKASGDYGADVISTAPNGRKIAIQTKLYSEPVGFDAVKEASFGKIAYSADEAWVITNSSYTPQAIKAAAMANVRLIERDGLNAIAFDGGLLNEYMRPAQTPLPPLKLAQQAYSAIDQSPNNALALFDEGLTRYPDYACFRIGYALFADNAYDALCLMRELLHGVTLKPGERRLARNIARHKMPDVQVCGGLLLNIACCFGDAKAVESLLNCGANATKGEGGRKEFTPIQWATCFAHPRQAHIVRLLQQAGANFRQPINPTPESLLAIGQVRGWSYDGPSVEDIKKCGKFPQTEDEINRAEKLILEAMPKEWWEYEDSKKVPFCIVDGEDGSIHFLDKYGAIIKNPEKIKAAFQSKEYFSVRKEIEQAQKSILANSSTATYTSLWRKAPKVAASAQPCCGADFRDQIDDLLGNLNLPGTAGVIDYSVSENQVSISIKLPHESELPVTFVQPQRGSKPKLQDKSLRHRKLDFTRTTLSIAYYVAATVCAKCPSVSTVTISCDAQNGTLTLRLLEISFTREALASMFINDALDIKSSFRCKVDFRRGCELFPFTKKETASVNVRKPATEAIQHTGTDDSIAAAMANVLELEPSINKSKMATKLSLR